MIRWTIPALALLAVFFPTASAHSLEPRDVSAELRTIVVQSGVPGLVAATVDTHGIIARGAAGVRRKGSPSLMTVNDKLHLGSCSKAMTATVIARLVEAEKLSWSTGPVEIFAASSKDFDRGWGTVNLSHLLTHSSGAPHTLDEDGLWARLWAHNGSPREQRMALVTGVLVRPPESKPGEKYIYSNAGYAIAGAMAEQVSDLDWETLARNLLFEPLGMTSAGFGPPGTPDRVDQPRGHKESGEVMEPGRSADNPASIAPAGTLHCTIGDWATFVQLHLDAELGKPRLLTAETFQTLHTPGNNLKPSYAMGWGIVQREWAGGKTLTHNGTNTMWFSAVWMAPLKGFAVMAVCNQGGKKAEKAVDDAVSMLIREHLENR